jgi:acetoin utilization protein AcuB
MSKPIPPVQKYMTHSPVTIGVEQTIAHARDVMHEHHIRHLPVLHGGRIVGLLSERDVALVESLNGVDPTKVTVEDAMSQAPYTTSPDTTIDRVASEMAEHKYGAAVIVQNNKVVGVFTTVDACRTLAEIFDGRLK